MYIFQRKDLLNGENLWYNFERWRRLDGWNRLKSVAE